MANNDLLWIVFFGVICALVLLILVFLLADAIKTNRKLKNGGNGSNTINVYVDKNGNVSSNQPSAVKATVKVTEGSEAVASAPVPADGTVLKAKERLLFKDELSKADSVTRRDEVEVIKHFQELDSNIRINESSYHVLVSYGSYKLCKLAFSRGVLKANFFVASSEFKLYSKASNNVAVKEKPTSVDLNAAEALPVCYQLADLAYAQAKEAKLNRAKKNA